MPRTTPPRPMGQSLEDWLVKNVFQVLCDQLTARYGWSNRVPAAILYFVGAIGMLPIIGHYARGGTYSAWFLCGLTIVWILRNVGRVNRLCQGEILSDFQRTPPCLEPLEKSGPRHFDLVMMMVITTPPFLFLPFDLTHLVILGGVIAVAGYVGAGFFIACDHHRSW